MKIYPKYVCIKWTYKNTLYSLRGFDEFTIHIYENIATNSYILRAKIFPQIGIKYTPRARKTYFYNTLQAVSTKNYRNGTSVLVTDHNTKEELFGTYFNDFL